MSDLLSVSDCAKRLGVSRPKLTKLLDQKGVDKIKRGREQLVSFADASEAVRQGAAEGLFRTPNRSKTSSDTQRADPDIIDFLKKELHRVTEERNALGDRVKALESIEVEVKRLKSAEDAASKQVDSLLTKVEMLQAQLEQAVEAKDKNLVRRLSKAISAFRE